VRIFNRGSYWYCHARPMGTARTPNCWHTLRMTSLVGPFRLSTTTSRKSITTRPSVQLAPARVRVRFDATTVR